METPKHNDDYVPSPNVLTTVQYLWSDYHQIFDWVEVHFDSREKLKELITALEQLYSGQRGFDHVHLQDHSHPSPMEIIFHEPGRKDAVFEEDAAERGWAVRQRKVPKDTPID